MTEDPPVCGIGPAPVQPDPEPVQDAPSPIYGTGTPGYGDVRRRHLLVLMPLADHADPLHPERSVDQIMLGQMLDHDIREAMVKAARKLNDTAMKYSVTGYTWDLEDIVYDMPRPRVLAATLVIERD